MHTLTIEEEKIHQQALRLSHRHRQLEWELIQVLGKVDRAKLYRKFDRPSLFAYAVETLGFSEAIAYSFITVARKVGEVALLGEAIASEKLSVAKASRMVSGLTSDNAAKLIDFAIHHTTRETEMEVARLNPKTPARDKVKPVNEDQIQLTLTIDRATLEKLERAKALVRQKGHAGKSLGETFAVLLDSFLQANDPLEKAKRAQKRKTKFSQESLCTNRAETKKDERHVRQPLTAAQKHAVFARDQGRCTHLDANGRRCNSQHFVEVHHIRPVSQGGSNDPTNLTTLCSFHHDLAHQLALPLDGQVTWLREREVRYEAYSGTHVRAQHTDKSHKFSRFETAARDLRF